jgi:hypothetical protein
VNTLWDMLLNFKNKFKFLYYYVFFTLNPPFQIISHSKNLGELEHLKFDQNYKKLKRFITSNRYTIKI